MQASPGIASAPSAPRLRHTKLAVPLSFFGGSTEVNHVHSERHDGEISCREAVKITNVPVLSPVIPECSQPG